MRRSVLSMLMMVLVLIAVFAVPAVALAQGEVVTDIPVEDLVPYLASPFFVIAIVDWLKKLGLQGQRLVAIAIVGCAVLGGGVYYLPEAPEVVHYMVRFALLGGAASGAWVLRRGKDLELITLEPAERVSGAGP